MSPLGPPSPLPLLVGALIRRVTLGVRGLHRPTAHPIALRTRDRQAGGDGEKEDGLPGSAARLEERGGDQEVRAERREERRLLLQVGHLLAASEQQQPRWADGGRRRKFLVLTRLCQGLFTSFSPSLGQTSGS